MLNNFNYKVVELIGDDIMMAYDGDYISADFGYSCANFNVQFTYSMHDDNDKATFDLYTKNRKNISCFVCYDKDNRICGRRMFFKGPSMVNNDVFNTDVEMGYEIRYLYGYYGVDNSKVLDAIEKAVISKYGDKLIYSDEGVFKNGVIDDTIFKYWIMQIENVNFAKYPPVDLLSVSLQLKALSNFKPSFTMIDTLEQDFGKKRVVFNQAYRFKSGIAAVKTYDTWKQHRGKK